MAFKVTQLRAVDKINKEEYAISKMITGSDRGGESWGTSSQGVPLDSNQAAKLFGGVVVVTRKKTVPPAKEDQVLDCYQAAIKYNGVFIKDARMKKSPMVSKL